MSVCAAKLLSSLGFRCLGTNMPSPLKASPFTFGKQPPNGYITYTADSRTEVTRFFTLISILWNSSAVLEIPCSEMIFFSFTAGNTSGNSKNSEDEL